MAIKEIYTENLLGRLTMTKSKAKKLGLRDWHGTLLPPRATVRNAIRVLNEVCLRIVLVVDARGKLVGTVSDGDIRRAMLRGQGLETPLSKILHRNPLVAHHDHRRDAIIQLMLANEVQQIPVVDNRRRVVGLHLWDELSRKTARPNIMVVMAGGEGKRLGALTADRPKPLVEVGGKPILEHILLKAKEEGFCRFALAVRHMGNLIEDYFGDGKPWGVRISYMREKMPLGTAGAIRLLNPPPREPLLITNGDVLADFNYGGLLDFHLRHGAEATMAVRAHEWQNPYGVVETQGLEIIGFREKPMVRTQINAGVYVLNPGACRLIPRGVRFDMPELFKKLKVQGLTTLAYPLHEPWVDIGKPEDVRRASVRMMQKKNPRNHSLKAP